MLEKTRNIKKNVGEFLEDAAIGSMDIAEQLFGRNYSRNYYLGEGKIRELNLAYFKKCRRRAAKTLTLLAAVCLLFGGCKGYQYHKKHQTGGHPAPVELER